MKSLGIKLLLLAALVAGAASAQTAKMRYAVLLDNTGSMRTQSVYVRETAKAVVRKANAVGAPVSVFGFASNGSVASIAGGLECSTSIEDLTKQIDTIAPVGGQTTLIDAIDVAAERIGKPTSTCGQGDEHIVVLLSDGQDRASTLSADELFKSLKTSGVKIYVVAMVSELITERGFTAKSPRAKAEDFLKEIVSRTGGRIVFPKKEESAQAVVDRLFSAAYRR